MNNINNIKNLKHKTVALFTILIFIFFIIYIIFLYYKKYNESFIPKPEPIDKTRLYGTLFLDNLDTQIQNLTNPPIMYDKKRIEIIKYNDVLL
jgi:hypothetical protein